MTTERLVGAATVARWFNVKTSTVAKWLDRHPDMPQPDVIIESDQSGVPGWKPSRETEIRAWYAGRPRADVKISATHITEIKARYAQGGITQQQLGDEYGITQWYVSYLIRKEP